jgi:hypothetical protein
VTTEIDAVFEQAVQLVRDAGAVVDPVFIPSLDEYNASLSEIIVLMEMHSSSGAPVWPRSPGTTLVTVTGGSAFGLPVGLTFMASAWSAPTLIEVASGYEAAAGVNQRPRFLETFSGDEVQSGGGPGSRATAGSHRAIGSQASPAMQRQIATQRQTKDWRPAGL